MKECLCREAKTMARVREELQLRLVRYALYAWKCEGMSVKWRR